jgi:hypothetical protein
MSIDGPLTVPDERDDRLIDYLRCEEILREKHAKPLGRLRRFSTVPSIRNSTA